MMGEDGVEETVMLKLEVTVHTLGVTPTAEFRTHVLNKLTTAGDRALHPLTKAGYISGVGWTTIFPSSPGSYVDIHPGDVETGNPLIQKEEGS